MSGPLSHLRILDLSSVVMGPYCTMLLGDMGADVIKIEKSSGDITRYVGPSRNDGMGSNFLNLNRNKRSMTLDLKSEKGHKILLELVKNSDVIIHSFRAQTMQKLGLSYEDVSAENKKIIYCGMYGYSQKGPYGPLPAYDDIIQAGSGVASAQGEMTGEPQYVSSLLADKTTGLIGLSTILSALLYRVETGIGQEIEVPMYESMVSYTMIEHMYGETFSPPIGNSFYSRATSPYRKPYKTSDGYLGVLIYNDKQWASFLNITDHQHLLEDERFKNMNTRSKNTDYIYQLVEQIMSTKKTTEWVEVFKKGDIPFMPINYPKDLFHDPHLQYINFFEKVNHPTEGEIRDIKFPVNFSKTPSKVKRLAPTLGEHNKETLGEIGYSNDEIEEIMSEYKSSR